MITVESRTNEIEIDKQGIYKPNAPLFIFQNTGNTYMYVNSRVLYPGEIWGIDNSTGLQVAMAFGKQLSVKETTGYNIAFGNTLIDSTGPYGAVITPRGVLIRTEFVLINQ